MRQLRRWLIWLCADNNGFCAKIRKKNEFFSAFLSTLAIYVIIGHGTNRRCFNYSTRTDGRTNKTFRYATH